MENYSYSSYPDSGDSSPISREIDCENASWDDPPSNYKVKFMCSYGGKIHPRPHDNQLAYIGGDTKILSVDRNIRFSGIISKLSSLCDSDVCFKYQLPGEDLDALISVTNDEDLEHMMLEYDRLYRASAKPARLRLFLFPLNPPAPGSFDSNSPKSERQWFVDALNSVQVQSLEASDSPPLPPPSAAPATNPDFLFGLDKGIAPAPVTKLQDPTPAPMVPDMLPKDISTGSDAGSEDRHAVGDPVMSEAEIQRQIQELQRLQISNHEQAMFHRNIDESNQRAYSADYYAQRVPEKHAPAPQPVQMPIPAAYWQERQNMNTGGYAMAAATGPDPSVYLISTPAGMYQAPSLRPGTGQVGQAYYGMQRGVPEVYREQSMYNAVQAPSLPQPRVGPYNEGMGMVRPPTGGVGIGVGEGGYTQVGYDSAGRQVFYTAPGVGDGGYTQVGYDSSGRQVYCTAPGGMGPSYQGTVDVRQGGPQEGKVVGKSSQASSL